VTYLFTEYGMHKESKIGTKKNTQNAIFINNEICKDPVKRIDVVLACRFREVHSRENKTTTEDINSDDAKEVKRPKT
jgi:hypothetical protein